MPERMQRWLLAFCLSFALGTAAAVEAPPLADDVALEARVMEIAEELRCLVCQNETIAASHADLALDLRQQIRTRLQAGESRQQILDFMVERYGDFVLYRPRFGAKTLLLWLGPFVLLLGALLALWINIRQRAAATEPGLTPDEARRAGALLDELREER